MSKTVPRLLAALILFLLPAGAMPTFAQGLREVPKEQAQIQLSFAPVVKEAAPAVVNVYSKRVVKTAGSPFQGTMFERMFGPGMFGPQERVQQSLGSGVIVSPDGVIVTNNHVVDGGQELRVVLSDRREFDAKVLLTDDKTDLAVLKINPEGDPFPVMPFHEKGQMEVGDLVIAIGNPFGVGQTVTSGIISGLGRTDVGQSDYSSFIQTDAAINPGNSGGALVNMKGELVGINSEILSRSGGSNGIGFAIPVSMVRRVVEAALSDGQVIRPWFGARLQEVDNDLAATLGMDRPQGTLVSEVWPGSAADRAGIKRGDVVLTLDGQPVNSQQGLRFALATHKLDKKLPVTILRDGKQKTLTLKTLRAPEKPKRQVNDISGQNPLQGAQVANLSPALAQETGLDPFERGVVIMKLPARSMAAYFGFRPGDIILEVDQRTVRNVNDLESALNKADGQHTWPVRIERKGREIFATLRSR